MTDLELWWITVIAAIAAAILSGSTTIIARRGANWVTPRRRVVLDLVSYAIMTVSVLAFIARGLLAP